LPPDVEDAKEFAAETLGMALLNLNRVEGQFVEALSEAAADRAEVMHSITVAV